LVKLSPDRAYLAFDRLEPAYRALGAPRRFAQMCRRLIDGNPQDWRARLALSRHIGAAGQPREAFDLLLDALVHNPHGLTIHQDIWNVLITLGLDESLFAGTWRFPAQPASISIRTSASDAPTPAPSRSCHAPSVHKG